MELAPVLNATVRSCEGSSAQELIRLFIFTLVKNKSLMISRVKPAWISYILIVMIQCSFLMYDFLLVL